MSYLSSRPQKINGSLKVTSILKFQFWRSLKFNVWLPQMRHDEGP